MVFKNGIKRFSEKKEIKEYEAFKKMVTTFMKNISNLEKMPEIYYSSQLEQMVYREENINLPVSNLSAGYQSLLWMVMNLSYRLALLNPEYAGELQNMQGIVLIDEIDMHLHPKWQWNIIKALEETFPGMQFLVATHSPIVISSCKSERMLMVTEDQAVMYLQDAYGYSVQDVLNFRQGTTEKLQIVKELDKQFDEAIDQDEWKTAEDVILQMERVLGKDHPDVRGAQEELKLNRWEAD